jgi:hypothetical protein
MILAILATIILGALGMLRWAVGSIFLMFLDGSICTIIENETIERPAIMSVQEATSGKYSIHSGIFTDYISIDISIAWLIGIIIYELYKKAK